MGVTSCRYIVDNGQEEHAIDLVEKFLHNNGVQSPVVERYRSGVISVLLKGLETTVKNQLDKMMSNHFREANYLGRRM